METAKASNKRNVEIDFLYLDLDVCTRCKGTDANLEKALDEVKTVLEASRTEVIVRKVLVNSEATARKYRFVSSPTIRVNGRDIAMDLKETPCDSCAQACGCNGSVDCRVWLYDGKEYNEAPVPLIVNALLTEIYSGQKSIEALAGRSFVLPENLKRFSASKTAKQESASCCSADEKTNCCEPREKWPVAVPPMKRR